MKINRLLTTKTRKRILLIFYNGLVVVVVCVCLFFVIYWLGFFGRELGREAEENMVLFFLNGTMIPKMIP